MSPIETTVPKEIQQILAADSENETGQPGNLDRVYINKTKKLMILAVRKPSVKDHFLPEKTEGTVSGIKWYLGRFLKANLPQALKKHFDHWKILGIAASGNLSLKHLHEFSCFTLDTVNQKIRLLPQVKNFMTEEQFLALFNSLDEEKAVIQVSTSSKKINNLLRSIDSQKRPVLLSVLMICLHQVKHKTTRFRNDFPDSYKTFSAGSLITKVLDTVQKILHAEGIPQEKLKALGTELAFLKTDQTLNNDKTAILKEVLVELETVVIPLFDGHFASNSNYDIIGKFYEEFLKYAGVSNVKRGIVLTPRHITTLFTKLVDLREDDKIVDICCGTGAFLIAGMNTLLERIGKNSRADKDKVAAAVKENQLLGFEVNATMYLCAVSNMLFRADGKLSIFNYDSIHDPRVSKMLKDFGATVGFINPPYSGKETKEDPTPKEITFLAKLLDHCSRYAVMIAPLSTFFKEEQLRIRLLKKHTLRYVINMSDDLFQPNASIHTAVAVFETNRPFDYENDEVVFYDLRDDGFVLSKNQGRTDVYGRWHKIEKELLDALKPASVPDGIKLVRTKIKSGDEWTVYAHGKTDYSALCEEDFIKSISDYMIFDAKKNLQILNSDLSEMQLIEALGNYFSGNQGIQITTANQRTNQRLNMSFWREFRFNELFDIAKGKRLTKSKMAEGDIPFIGASAFNNGITAFVDIDHHIHTGNTITIAYNGSVGNAFYQPVDFFACDDVNVLYPKKFTLNCYIAFFLITAIEQLQNQFGFGRKWNLERMLESQLKLPVDQTGQPDWQFMEDYIKSLPYSDLI